MGQDDREAGHHGDDDQVGASMTQASRACPSGARLLCAYGHRPRGAADWMVGLWLS